MPASIFSETELARLASFPEEIPGDDLIRAFTLTGADRDLVASRRGAANRLGLALQLCALRYLGFVPRNLSAAPRSAACFAADQLEVSPDEIQSYARREQTRRQHFTEVREPLGFSMLRSRDLEELEAWLVERALEHFSGSIPVPTQQWTTALSSDLLTSGIASLARQEAYFFVRPQVTSV